MDNTEDKNLLLPAPPPSQSPLSTTTVAANPHPKPSPKRFIKNQIPDSILTDPCLNAAISLLPSNYNLEIHKIIHRIRSTNSKRVALQFPEGLLMFSLILSDIITSFTSATHVFILGDVTYGACCVDDFSAASLSADLLVHFGHSCLVPVDFTSIPCLYIFVDIKIDVENLISNVKNAFNPHCRIVLAGTIQFGSAIRGAKPELEKLGFRVLVPQSKPLSAGEVLGCTAPSLNKDVVFGNDDETVLVFVADGRFHLEAFMIANATIRAFRYDPFIGKLFLEEYDHKGMKESRKNTILRVKAAKNWGVILGTLGRQGNPRILERLERKMREKGLNWTVVLMSEISPKRITLFEDAVDAWIQIACPRLSIDWGDAFEKPLLTSFEAEIALGDLPGWWERRAAVNLNSDCKVSLECGTNESCCASSNANNVTDNGYNVNHKPEMVVDYPMDYYAQDGGEWNSSYMKKTTRPTRRSIQACNEKVSTS